MPSSTSIRPSSSRNTPPLILPGEPALRQNSSRNAVVSYDPVYPLLPERNSPHVSSTPGVSMPSSTSIRPSSARNRGAPAPSGQSSEFPPLQVAAKNSIETDEEKQAGRRQFTFGVNEFETQYPSELSENEVEQSDPLPPNNKEIDYLYQAVVTDLDRAISTKGIDTDVKTRLFYIRALLEILILYGKYRNNRGDINVKLFDPFIQKYKNKLGEAWEARRDVVLPQNQDIGASMKIQYLFAEMIDKAKVLTEGDYRRFAAFWNDLADTDTDPPEYVFNYIGIPLLFR